MSTNFHDFFGRHAEPKKCFKMSHIQIIYSG